MKRILPILFQTILCLPVIAFAKPDDLPIDFGADVTSGCLSLTANFYDDTFLDNGDVVLSYIWDFGDGNISTDYDPAPSHTYSSPGSYTVTMTIITLNGLAGSKTKTNFINVGNNFSIDIGADASVCGMTPVTFDATTSGATYLWSTGSTNPTISTTGSGEFSVIVNRYGCVAKDTIILSRTAISVNLGPDQEICDGTSIDLSAAGNPGADITWSTGSHADIISVMDEDSYFVDVSKDGCTVSDTINITVKPALNLNFGYARKSGCLPVDYQFTDSTTACSGTIYDWTWDFGDGAPISKAQNPVHTFTHTGTFTVRLSASGTNGFSLSKFKIVTIAPADVTVDLGPDTTICFGETLTIDAQNPGADFAWSTGDVTQRIDVQDDGDYAVAVTRDGCVARDTITVHTAVSAIPKWGYRVNGNCLPIDVNFLDSSLAFCGQHIASWKWDFGDGTVSTQPSPVHTYTSADSFNVKLSVTTNGGNTVTKLKKIKVNNISLNLDMPDQVNVCRNGSVVLDASVADAMYAWRPSAGLTASDIRNPTLTPTTNGWYSVTVSKCGVIAIDSIYILVDTSANPVIAQNGNSLSGPAGGSYEWFLGGNRIQGAITRAIRVDQAGYYTVRVNNTNGCSGISDPYFYVPVSGDEKTTDGVLIKLSPNPGNGVIKILLSQIPSKPAKVSVYDAAGKILLNTSAPDHVNSLDLSKFMKGIYFVEVIIDSKRTILPLVLQ